MSFVKYIVTNATEYFIYCSYWNSHCKFTMNNLWSDYFSFFRYFLIDILVTSHWELHFEKGPRLLRTSHSHNKFVLSEIQFYCRWNCKQDYSDKELEGKSYFSKD